MSIAKPFTFVAGQKARANEVNADFDTLYSQVNINIADIAQINRDVDGLESDKADINGNSTQRFAVANPVNSTDSVNKQTLTKSLTNMLDYINGLTIEKDTNSPKDTILVNTGSCYDSTKEVVLELSNITSKKNEGQGANATYYVYIIGNQTGTTIDILISNSSIEPTLPTGYTKFRNIGNFITNSSNVIYKINNYSNSNVYSFEQVSTNMAMDFNRRQNLSVNTTYTANEPTWVYMFAVAQNNRKIYFQVNGLGYDLAQNYNSDTDTSSGVILLLLSSGSTYRLPTDGGGSHWIFRMPCKGGN